MAIKNGKILRNVGTIGHFKHGKTTLTAAILEVQSKRGLAQAIPFDDFPQGSIIIDDETEIFTTVAPSEFHYETIAYYYNHIDFPGRPEYSENVLAGLAQLDGAILVVSVIDSVCSQTKEHVLLARQAGLTHLVVFVNNCDMIDDDEIKELMEEEVKDLLREHGFDSDLIPIIRGAALPALQGNLEWEESIENLLKEIDEIQILDECDR